MKKIESISQLRDALKEGHEDFVIYNGLIRSSKFIGFGEEKDFFVLHLIDDSEEELSEEELNKSNIGKAIENGTFYIDD